MTLRRYDRELRRGLPSWLASAGAAAVLFLASATAQAHALQWLPAVQSVALGQQASVVLRASDLQPEGLGAYTLDLGFDPSILAFDHAVDGFGLGLAFGLDVSPGTGSVTLSDFSLESIADLLALQGPAVDLFTVVFDSVGLGTSALDLRNVALGDAAGSPVDFTIGTASITVVRGALPEPAPAALLAAAVLALIWRRRSAPS